MTSSYEEEQLNEMEAMEAIYQQDYTRHSSRQYTIALTPNTDGSVNHGQQRRGSSPSSRSPPALAAAAVNSALLFV